MRGAAAAALLIVLALIVHLQTRPSAPRVVRVASDERAATAAGRGARVYTRYGCAACHGADGKGGFSNPNAETDGKVPAVIFVAEGYTRGELRRKILDGFATVGKADPKGLRPPYRMPGWAGQMTDQEVGDLTEYLMSLFPQSAAQTWR